MLSKGKDLSKDVRNMGNVARRELFTEPVVNFYKYSLPSFPLLGRELDNNIGQFSLLIHPSLRDQEFLGLLTNQRRVGGQQEKEIPSSPTMLNVSVYFDLPLLSYSYLRSKCIPAYEWKKTYRDKTNNVEYWEGTHLAEGSAPEWNWRELIPPLINEE
jgi:hypothetical protein